MRTSTVTLAALAAAVALTPPVRLAAQQPGAGAPPANPITTAFRGRILAQHRNLAQAFDSIPGAKFGFKPTPAQQTIGYVAQHLVNDNYFFCSNFGAAKPTRAEKESSTPDSVKATWPKEELVTNLKASFAFCESALGQLDDAKLAEQFSMTLPNGQTRSSTRASMVLGHALDLTDHYSQIANYMRLNGMLPPTALPRPRPPGSE
jgi:uncharacterized damage-inducible protein DinB